MCSLAQMYAIAQILLSFMRKEARMLANILAEASLHAYICGDFRGMPTANAEG